MYYEMSLDMSVLVVHEFVSGCRACYLDIGFGHTSPCPDFGLGIGQPTRVYLWQNAVCFCIRSSDQFSLPLTINLFNPFKVLYIKIQLWYCTLLGKSNHFNRLSMFWEGVRMSSRRTILAARFRSFISVLLFAAVQTP